MKAAILIGKLVVGAVWVYCAAAFFVSTLPLAEPSHWVFGIMALAHVVEAVAYKNLIQRTGDPPAGHVVQVLLFGIFHKLEMDAQVAGASPERG